VVGDLVHNRDKQEGNILDGSTPWQTKQSSQQPTAVKHLNVAARLKEELSVEKESRFPLPLNLPDTVRPGMLTNPLFVKIREKFYPNNFGCSFSKVPLITLVGKSVINRKMATISSESENAEVVENLHQVKRKISDISAKLQLKKEPRLVAVSKTKPATMILACYKDNHKIFGENYVQELVEKASQLPEDIEWHFIGHLQGNKAKLIVNIPNLAMVETVDNLKLAKTLDKHAKQLRKSPLPVMVQVNTSGEDTAKSGCEPSECVQLVDDIKKECPNLKLSGLMTIGRPDAPPDQPDFILLSNLKKVVCEKLSIRGEDFDLSMGMSHDFEQAIQFGSTSVRVGSSIFGLREKKST